MDSAPYERHPLWQAAMDLAEQLHTLKTAPGSPQGGPLLDRLRRASVAAASRIAAAVEGGGLADSAPAPPEAASSLLEIETLLLLGGRLGCFEAGGCAASLSLARRMRWTGVDGPPTEVDAPAAKEDAPVPKAPAAPRSAGAARPRTREPASGVDRLLVDGCNFLGRAPGYTLGSDRSRDDLLFRLQEYGKAHPSHRLTAFFDGQKTAVRQAGGVEVPVTGGQRPADDVILEYLRDLPQPDLPRATLVTDDRDLAVRARALGARAESVAWLHGRLARKAVSPSRGEEGAGGSRLDEWVEFFSQPPKRPGKG